jgi:hypothetical protein
MLSNFFKFISNKYLIYPIGKNSIIVEIKSNTIFEMISESNKLICEKINEYISIFLIYFGDFYEYMQNLQLKKLNKIKFNFKIDKDGIDNFKLRYSPLLIYSNEDKNKDNKNDNSNHSVYNLYMSIKCLMIILKYYLDLTKL